MKMTSSCHEDDVIFYIKVSTVVIQKQLILLFVKVTRVLEPRLVSCHVYGDSGLAICFMDFVHVWMIEVDCGAVANC